MNALFEEMQREKVKKTDAVYHVFFKFYAKTRQIQEMKKLFAQMRDEKAQPTLPTLNLLEQSFRASKDEEVVLAYVSDLITVTYRLSSCA
jgi:pentatricopeptide repeat protein